MNATYTKATHVFCDGPITGGCDENDEFPIWTVCLMDDNGDEAGTVYTCYSRSKAQELGRKIARDRRVELVDETTYA